jgi:hypothetical protein
MTNTLPVDWAFTGYLPQGKDPAKLGLTNNNSRPSKEQESLIYVSEESRARAREALVQPNNSVTRK